MSAEPEAELDTAPTTPDTVPEVIPGISEEYFYRYCGPDCNYQFLGGDLVREPSSGLQEELFAFLLSLFRCYLGERGGGVALGSRYPMRLDEKWSPEPDLLVVSEKRRHLVRKQYLDGPADLVIEIVSGSHPRLDLRRKLPRYREAHIPEIWLIDPFARSVRVEALQGEGYETRILSSGRLAPRVLPGFWIDAAWLWQEPLPAPLPCLRQILG